MFTDGPCQELSMLNVSSVPSSACENVSFLESYAKTNFGLYNFVLSFKFLFSLFQLIPLQRFSCNR